MRNKWLVFILGVVALLPQPPVQAAEPLPEVLLPSSPWEIATEVDACALTRGFDKERTALTIRSTPTAAQIYITIASTGWPPQAVDESDFAMLFAPSGQKATGTAAIDRWIKDRIGMVDLYGVSLAELRRAGDTSDVSIMMEKAPPIRFHLTNLAAAFRALDKCHNDLMRHWAMDPDTLYTMRALPVAEGSRSKWLDIDDYPDWALAQNREGKILLSYIVQINGRVRDCKTVVSSGDDKLDHYTCVIMTRRAHYRPAIDAQRRPVEMRIVESVRWVAGRWRRT